MKATILKKTALVVGSLSFLAGSAFSQTAVSGAGGYRTQTLGQGFNVVGVNLHNPVLVSGTIDTEAGADVGDSAVDYTAILADAAATYIFEVTSGVQDGAIAFITASANGSVTVEGAIGAGVGESYSIRQAPTLNDTFGALNPGFTAASADVVYITTGVGGAFDTYFQHTTGEFRVSGSFANPPKPISFLYSDGLLVERKLADPVDVVITGMVKTTGTVVNLPVGFGPIAVAPPVGGTLQDSGLAAVLGTGFTAASADVIYVPTAPGAFDQYFVHTTGAIRAAGSFADAPPVPVDNGLLVETKGAGSAGLYALPAFYANL